MQLSDLPLQLKANEIDDVFNMFSCLFILTYGIYRTDWWITEITYSMTYLIIFFFNTFYVFIAHGNNPYYFVHKKSHSNYFQHSITLYMHIMQHIMMLPYIEKTTWLLKSSCYMFIFEKRFRSRWICFVYPNLTWRSIKMCNKYCAIENDG